MFLLLLRDKSIAYLGQTTVVPTEVHRIAENKRKRGKRRKPWFSGLLASQPLVEICSQGNMIDIPLLQIKTHLPDEVYW